MNPAKKLLEEAERAARDSETWARLSNFLFNPGDGLVARAYPTRADREAFIQTDEYRKIRQLVSDAREHHGLVEGRRLRRATGSSSRSLSHYMPRWSARRWRKGNEGRPG